MPIFVRTSEPKNGLLALLVCLWLMTFPSVGHAQQSTSANLFQTVRPEVFVVVRKHSTGADLVEITMVDPTYPPGLLRERVNKLGEYLGSPVRGVFVSDPKMPGYAGSTKATFGVDGIMQNGKFRLTPVARAFAGIDSPNEISGISVVFEKQTPNADTVKDYRSDAVDVQADSQPGSIGIEYRISLKDQNPSHIEIPDSALAVTTGPNQIVPRGGPDTATYVLIGLAAVAVGALVYSLTLRGPRRR
jgi:hypothetical protein